MEKSRGKIGRAITWNGESSISVVNIKEYMTLMKAYGRDKAKSVRSARKYLRSLGLVLNREGEIIGKG